MKRLLLQHSARGAVFDRYNIIRNFFRQQLPPASPTRSHTSHATFRSAATLHYTLRARVGLRQYSTESPSRQEQPKQTNQQTDRSSEESESSRKEGSDQLGPENYPRFFRRLALSLPHLQRPTRDDFLRAADGFWQRARIRFRWLTIRSFRRYNADEMSAFFTWFLMSQTLWLFVGT